MEPFFNQSVTSGLFLGTVAILAICMLFVIVDAASRAWKFLLRNTVWQYLALIIGSIMFGLVYSQVALFAWGLSAAIFLLSIPLIRLGFVVYRESSYSPLYTTAVLLASIPGATAAILFAEYH